MHKTTATQQLVIHPTETAQWYSLVGEAQWISQCFLDESLESYLVFLLMRHVQSPELTDSVLALELAESQQAVGSLKIERLKKLGDKSLLFSGLFPGLASRKRVNVTYFRDIGQTAYLMVAELQTCELFHDLAHGFTAMSKVLKEISGIVTSHRR